MMANDVIRSGSIHAFGHGGPGPDIAAFAGASAIPLGNRAVPVRVIESSTLRTIGEGTLDAARVEGDELIGAIRWPSDLDERVAAGDATARCRFSDDGSIVKVVVELDEDDDDGEYQDDPAEFALTSIDSSSARFSTVIPTTHRRTEGGFNIYPDAILFEVGDYADKGFSMSESEAARAVSRFASPVGGNIEHTNFMRGRACQVRSLRIDPDDPRIIRGEVALPSTFDDHLIDEERRVSCEWDRATKELTGLALTVNPRVKKAALVAAFAANEATADDVAAFAAEDDADPEIIAAFATPRKHDPDLSRQMQGLHDNIAAHHPWTCGGSAQFAATFGDKPKQFKAIKTLHDQTTEHGASCPGTGKSKTVPFSGRSPMSATANTKKRGMLARLFGLGDESAAVFNEVVSEEMADKFLSDLTADGAVATGDDAVTDVAQKVAEAAPAAFNLADAPEFKALQAELAAERQKNADNAAELERRRVAEVRSDAEDAANRAIFSHKADAVEFDDLVELYIDAAEADHAKGGVVTFSAADGTKVEGSRVAKFSAMIERRPSRPGFEPSNLSGERPLTSADIVKFSGATKGDAAKAARDEADAALATTPEGRAILERRKAKQG